MEALVELLAPDGYLIFNNHKHSNSLARRIALALGRAKHKRQEVETFDAPWDRTMSRGEVEAMVDAAGLWIVRTYPLASLPFTERHMPLPDSITEALERVLGKIQATASIAQDLIYVCQHRERQGALR